MRASASALTQPTPLMQHTLRALFLEWWQDEPARHGLEVLYDGREVELVTSAGEASKPQPLKAMVRLEVAEAHLDLFALVSRFEEGLGRHLAPCHVAGVFMEIARDLPRLVPGAALRSEWTDIAVAL